MRVHRSISGLVGLESAVGPGTSFRSTDVFVAVLADLTLGRIASISDAEALGTAFVAFLASAEQPIGHISIMALRAVYCVLRGGVRLLGSLELTGVAVVRTQLAHPDILDGRAGRRGWQVEVDAGCHAVAVTAGCDRPRGEGAGILPAVGARVGCC